MDKDLTYEQICFSLTQKENALSTLVLNQFVLNPEIRKLTEEIKELKDLKAEKEEQLDEAKN